MKSSDYRLGPKAEVAWKRSAEDLAELERQALIAQNRLIVLAGSGKEDGRQESDRQAERSKEVSRAGEVPAGGSKPVDGPGLPNAYELGRLFSEVVKRNAGESPGNGTDSDQGNPSALKGPFEEQAELLARKIEILEAALERATGGKQQAAKAVEEAERAIREGRGGEPGVAQTPPLLGRMDDALSAEVRAMLERGDPPERYSERKNRKEGAREFLARVYGRYLRKGDESIYLHEIRRLDPKFVRSLEIACRRAGEPVWLSVPKRSDLTERILASVAPGKLDAVTKAAEALILRKRRAAAKSYKV